MGGALARMMHEGNGRGVIALQAAQIGEQGGDFRGDVLVDGVQTHQRVKQDEVRPEKSHGRLQGLLVLLAIEPQRRHGDDMDIQALEFDACGMGNALETTSDDLRGILGGKQQDASGSRDLEVAQTRGAGGDRDGEIKRQKRFADLRFTSEDSAAVGAPQAFDQPGLLVGSGGASCAASVVGSLTAAPRCDGPACGCRG